MITIRMTENCRLYCKNKDRLGEKYFISRLLDGTFYRLIITEELANALKVMKYPIFSKTIEDLLRDAKEKGSGDYYEAKV